MSKRTIIIGDIHGCFDALQSLLEKLSVTDDDVLISVGDLVDRGPKSLEVCDYFRQRDGAIVLMGNHERKHVRNVLTYAQEIVRLQMGERYADTVEWMAGLPYFVDLDDAIVVHAAMELGVPLASQREDVLAGTTSGTKYLGELYGDGFWTDHYDDDKPVIFGHHVVGDDVKVWNERVYGIDTGACHGGRLSAVVLPGFDVVQVDVDVDHWKQQKLVWQAAVLAGKPWSSMPFAAIDRELARAKRRSGPGVAEVVTAVRAWLEQLDAARSEISLAIDSATTSLLGEHGDDGFGRAAGAHPAKGWLFRHRRDPVTPAAVSESCHTPEAITRLGESLGLSLPKEPERPAMQPR